MSSVHPSLVIYIDNPDTASDFLGRTTEPQDTRDIHLLMQRRTSSQVNQVEHGVQISRHPGHLPVSAPEVDSGSAHRESKLGAV